MAPSSKVPRGEGATFVGAYHNVLIYQVDNLMAEDRDPLLVEREKSHGNYSETADFAQRLKNIIRSKEVHDLNYQQLESLDLICTKIARIVCGNPHEIDHWDDIAGYAKLGAESCK